MEIQPSEIYDLCRIAKKANEGHIGSSLSVLNILNTIFALKKARPIEFIMSKGHASLGLYLILKKYGYVSSEQFESFCQEESDLGGHPNYRKMDGIFGSTGSLGHGLPQGVGKAIALKAKGLDTQTVVLVGDGEMNEGSNWEAILLGAHHNLANLTCVVDFNGSSERALTVKKVPNAIEALGWSVSFVDGHNEKEIELELLSSLNAPKLIWASTIKGRGISFMEGNPEWHHKSPTEDELALIAKELGVA